MRILSDWEGGGFFYYILSVGGFFQRHLREGGVEDKPPGPSRFGSKPGGDSSGTLAVPARSVPALVCGFNRNQDLGLNVMLSWNTRGKGTRCRFFVVVASAGSVCFFWSVWVFFNSTFFQTLKENEFAGISLLGFILIEMVF